MKRNIYLSCIFIIMTHICIGQTEFKANETVKSSFKALYIIDFQDKPPIATRNAYIDPKRWLSWNHLSDSSSRDVCHLLKVDIIYVIKLMPNTKVLTLNDVLDLYKIQSKFRKLIKLDDEVIDYHETVLMSQNQIERVNVEKDNNSYYVQIILKGYKEEINELKAEKKRGEIRSGQN